MEWQETVQTDNSRIGISMATWGIGEIMTSLCEKVQYPTSLITTT